MIIGSFAFNLITTPDSPSGRPLIRQRVPFNVTFAYILDLLPTFEAAVRFHREVQ